jgi:hypothetical protein
VTRRLVYALVAVFVTTVGLAVANVEYTNHVDERRAASDRANAAAGHQSAVQTLQAVCALVEAQIAAYQETPPKTAAGQNSARAWLDLERQFGCVRSSPAPAPS